SGGVVAFRAPLSSAGARLGSPGAPRLMSLLSVVTWLTDGWMCRMIWLFSSIFGVTSSTMPEKKGCTVTVGTGVPVVVPAAVAMVVADWILVTKNSSVPTLSTAFWLLIAATRGLEST